MILPLISAETPKGPPGLPPAAPHSWGLRIGGVYWLIVYWCHWFAYMIIIHLLLSPLVTADAFLSLNWCQSLRAQCTQIGVSFTWIESWGSRRIYTNAKLYNVSKGLLRVLEGTLHSKDNNSSHTCLLLELFSLATFTFCSWFSHAFADISKECGPYMVLNSSSCLWFSSSVIPFFSYLST